MAAGYDDINCKTILGSNGDTDGDTREDSDGGNYVANNAYNCDIIKKIWLLKALMTKYLLK